MTSPSYAHIYEFHRAFFPGHPPTQLIRLDGLEQTLGVDAVYLKDESTRFGLPAFKILGASWGLIAALSRRYNVDHMDFDAIGKMAQEEGLTVYAATDGNHGRATAHTARRLGIPCTIFVPRTVEPWSVSTIEGEGAKVVQLDRDYDETVKHAAEAAEAMNGLLVQDTAWEGYEQIPQDIVDGYTHLFHEISTQLPLSASPSHVIIPVGVGSLALAGALSYQKTSTQILTVEPQTAACLHHSLSCASNETISTGETIMPGLNCGTVSYQAWPVLSQAMRPQHATTIMDAEARASVEELKRWGVEAGPCGAAPLAALRKFDKDVLGEGALVVLICTEGRQ